MIIATNHHPIFDTAVYANPGPVTANALAMLRQELAEKYQVDAPQPGEPAGHLIIEPPTLAAKDDQSFRLRTERDGAGWRLSVTGSGERGVLYGLCEVLDRIESRDGDLWLPELNLTSSPTMTKRGTERHWLPRFSDEEGVEANITLIRALARKRINALLWIDEWISPGWYRFLEFRHYPPLHRPERGERVARAKDCLRRIVAEARAWGMEFYLSTPESARINKELACDAQIHQQSCNTNRRFGHAQGHRHLATPGSRREDAPALHPAASWRSSRR
jgi:hypothetical protein